jgi:hypothetical protein
MTHRLEQSLTKLYHAYHNDLLEPECSCGCAVGNILNRTDAWKHLSDEHGSLNLNYVGKVHEMLGRTFGGYKPSELLLIESTFLEACGYQTPLRHNHKKPTNPTDKDLQFSGLCAVASLLCAMDNVPDAMKLNNIFERENDKPRYSVDEILVA